MTKRFKNAYDALVKAYFNDHLSYTDCAKCAVGNIISHSNGYKYYDINRWKSESGDLVYTAWGDAIKEFASGEVKPDVPPTVLARIKPTGYSMKELALVEKKFHELDIDSRMGVIKKHECLYELVEFIASIDGDTLEFEENPFEKTEELAYAMV